MTITEARNWCRQFARNASDSTMYADAYVDRAIQAACDDFIRETRCTRAYTGGAVANGDTDVTGLPSLFRPELLLRAWVLETFCDLEPLSVTDWLEKQRCSSTATGSPESITWLDRTTPVVYPIADADYTIKIQWLEPLTVWTAGDGTAGATTLNLPDDWLRTILGFGATALMQHDEPEQAYASTSWAQYLAFRNSLRGTGGLGYSTPKRDRLED